MVISGEMCVSTVSHFLHAKLSLSLSFISAVLTRQSCSGTEDLLGSELLTGLCLSEMQLIPGI